MELTVLPQPWRAPVGCRDCLAWLCHRWAEVLKEAGRSWKFGVEELHWSGGVLFSILFTVC